MNEPWLIPHQQQLSTQIQQQKLPHALLLSGIKGAGNTSLANWLAQVLACQQPKSDTQLVLQPCQHCKHCQLFHSNTFPDHRVIAPEKSSLGVDAIRNASQFIQQKSQLNGDKTVIIEHAELMTESAANALLKTLEEPSERSYIILLVPDVQRVLPTVISRCRIIDVRPYVGENLQQQMNSQCNDNFMNLSHLPELTEQANAEAYIEFCQQLNQILLYQAPHSLLAQICVHDENGLRWLEKYLVNSQRDAMQWLTNRHEDNRVYLLAQCGVNTIEQCYKMLKNSQKLLVNVPQANKLFIIEKMLIDMQKCCIDTNAK